MAFPSDPGLGRLWVQSDTEEGRAGGAGEAADLGAIAASRRPRSESGQHGQGLRAT